MAALRYLHLDVFAATPGGGNHLGVVLGAGNWSGEAMQRFARWTNLVETTFLLAPTDPQASYRVRIFTPATEIPFAGHPSIGSAHAALQCGLASPDAGLLWQECAAGILPIRIEGSGATRDLLLKSPAERVVQTGLDAHPLLAAALANITTGQLPPALVDGGRRWWLAEVSSEASLRAWRPDHAAIGSLAAASDSMGLCAFARAQTDDGYQLVVRAFPAGVGIVEDPASGAANGLIAAYIARTEPSGALARGYVVSQGREIGHDARLLASIDGVVWVGGHSRIVIDGSLDWPVD